jgi:hypothetical protein
MVFRMLPQRQSRARTPKTGDDLEHESHRVNISYTWSATDQRHRYVWGTVCASHVLLLAFMSIHLQELHPCSKITEAEAAVSVNERSG